MIDPAALTDAQARFDFLREVPDLHLHARTSGGEYHGPCPSCGGADRFCAWPRHPDGPRAWCRQCHPEVMDPVAFLEWRDGLSFPEACARLGVGPAPPTALPRHVATYSYLDEAGVLLYQVLRYDPKTFRQRRPDGAGGWIWKLGDVRRVLYGLPTLRAAPDSAVVWLVEGEKDADALIARGVVATTNPGGAGSWRAEYAEALRDRYVVLVPDADAGGATWQAAVCASLVGVARAVKVVTLPIGDKDVSEFLEGGGTVATLAALAQATPRLDAPADPPAPVPDAPAPRFRVLTDAESDAIPPLDWLVDGYLLAGQINIAHGNGGSGKSLTCLDLALTLASGQATWQGHAARPGPVVYLAAEGPEEISQRKRGWKSAFACPTVPDFWLVPDQVPFMDPTAVPDLIACLPPDLHPALIVVDTLARTMGGDADENATRDMNGFVAACDTLRTSTGAAVLVIHHDNRGGTIRGNLALWNAARSSLAISMSDETITVDNDKHNNSGEAPPLRFHLRPVDDTVVLGLAATEDTDDGRLRGKARQLLAELCGPESLYEESGATPGELEKALGWNYQAIYRALRPLRARAYVQDIGSTGSGAHRYKATWKGFEALGILPPQKRAPVAPLTGVDSPVTPTPGGIDAAEEPLTVAPAAPLTITNPLHQAPIDTFDTPLTAFDTPLTAVVEAFDTFDTPPIRGVKESQSLTGENAADPAAVPPVWADPPEDAPPAPRHLGTCGHSALSIAWDAGSPGHWRCRSCWALHRE